MSSQHNLPQSAQIPLGRGKAVYDLTHKVLPVVFFLHFMTTGTVVLIYTLHLHEPLPTNYTVGAAIAFGCITTLIASGHLSVYCYKLHIAKNVVGAALVSPPSSRSGPVRREACLIKIRKFLVAYEVRQRQYVREFVLQRAKNKLPRKSFINGTTPLKELSFLDWLRWTISCMGRPNSVLDPEAESAGNKSPTDAREMFGNNDGQYSWDIEAIQRPAQTITRERNGKDFHNSESFADIAISDNVLKREAGPQWRVVDALDLERIDITSRRHRKAHPGELTFNRQASIERSLSLVERMKRKSFVAPDDILPAHASPYVGSFPDTKENAPYNSSMNCQFTSTAEDDTLPLKNPNVAKAKPASPRTMTDFSRPKIRLSDEIPLPGDNNKKPKSFNRTSPIPIKRGTISVDDIRAVAAGLDWVARPVDSTHDKHGYQTTQSPSTSSCAEMPVSNLHGVSYLKPFINGDYADDMDLRLSGSEPIHKLVPKSPCSTAAP